MSPLYLIGLEIIDESDQEVDMQKFARQKWENEKGLNKILKSKKKV